MADDQDVETGGPGGPRGGGQAGDGSGAGAGAGAGYDPSLAGVVAPTEVLSAAGSPEAEGGPEGEGINEDAEAPSAEQIERPAKVMRVGSMVKQLLEEVRQAPLDEAGRKRLREIYDQSIQELSASLSPDLADELSRLSLAFDHEPPSEAELRVAQAQLVGWLEGLFHGIQATLMAQQMAARAQLQELRQRQELPSGMGQDGRPGTYL